MELWFGTKGDGLLHIPDYRENEEVSAVTVYSPEGKQNVVSYIRWNKEFPVYKLVQSRYMDGFWIGSGDPGLFYYSFEDKALLLWRICRHNPPRYMAFMRKMIVYFMW